MAWSETIEEKGTLKIGEVEVPVNQVVTDKRMFIEGQEKNLEIRFVELASNEAFMIKGEEIVAGCTQHQRWARGDGKPERQTRFISGDGKFNFVVRSELITV